MAGDFGSQVRVLDARLSFVIGNYELVLDLKIAANSRSMSEDRVAKLS